MMPAQYAVVRITADPARDEPTNVGAVLWSDVGTRILVDDEALSSAARRYPYLATDALHFVEDYLRSGLEAWAYSPERPIAMALAALSRPPVSISEPRFVALSQLTIASIDVELNAIIERIVKLPKRAGGGGRTPRQELRFHLRPFIEQRLIRENQSYLGRSGNARRVDFVTGTIPVVALEAVSLAVKDADEIQRRSDALAFKVFDILAENQIRILLHCTFPDDDRFRDSIEGAQRSLTLAGAVVITSVTEAARLFRDQMSLI